MTWPTRKQFAIATMSSCALHVAAFLLLSHSSVDYRTSKLPRRAGIVAVLTQQLQMIPVVSSLAVSQSATPNNQSSVQAQSTQIDSDSDANTYLPTDLLDAQPVVIEDIPSETPELQGRSESGTIVLTQLINANGTVDQVIVESSDLPDIFAEVARRDFLTTRFSPGIRNAVAVPTAMRIAISTAPPAE